MLVVLDEFTRRCLAVVVARGSDPTACRWPEHNRSDNRPEFIAINVREWLGRISRRSTNPALPSKGGLGQPMQPSEAARDWSA